MHPFPQSLEPPPRRGGATPAGSSNRPQSPLTSPTSLTYPSNAYAPSSSYPLSSSTANTSASRPLINSGDSHYYDGLSSPTPGSRPRYNNNNNSNDIDNNNNNNNDGGALSSDFSRGGLYQDDPRNRRLDTLAKIDNADFGWFHVRACMVAGVGFFTDAYDLFAINLVSPMLGFVYFSHNGNSVPADIDAGLKIAASVGTFFGQIGFGYLADRLGRKRMYGVELVIIIVATFGQALSGNSYGLSLHWSIMIWRFILGIGVGGDYPLSAVITSEFATTNRRGAMMAAVFAMQGFGYLTTALVAILLLLGFKSMIVANPMNLDYVWRMLIGLGCVPALVAVYFRMTIPETPRYVLDVENNLYKAENDVNRVIPTRNALQSDRDEIEARNSNSRVNPRRNNNALGGDDGPTGSGSGYQKGGSGAGGAGGAGAGGGYNSLFSTSSRENDRSHQNKGTFRDFCHYFSRWETFKVLLGTSVTWFALDVAFYGIGLNNTFILSSIHFTTLTDEAYEKIWNATVGQAIIVLLGAIPGYWFTVFLIERLGRIKIQVLGFVMSCILFCILGFAYAPIHNQSPILFVFLFALTQFFQNFGPNATTFIIPGEVFPTRFRSTGHGISAGMGKLGAIVAQVGFSSLKDRGGEKNAGIPMLLQIFALFMFIGLLFTYLVPETRGKTLEELCGDEDYTSRQLERERFRQNGLQEKDENYE
ncbi:Inorganic phosphate transporter pho84 [Linnemannia exigua]|uniref:Inorganic phosphate transporter pho84 n=1 Tax=Linnemannia exigua TaxID=604196 RepID=A0AAD4D7W3_9FUNG|nr:Inorganic phosphate transporter pho84 [Linnemannia exigua]